MIACVVSKIKKNLFHCKKIQSNVELLVDVKNLCEIGFELSDDDFFDPNLKPEATKSIKSAPDLIEKFEFDQKRWKEMEKDNLYQLFH